MIGTLDDGSEEEQFKYGHFGGFWHLLEVKEINYQHNKKMKPVIKRYNKPISVLFELDIMSVSWFFDTSKPIIYPFHLIRKKLITNDVFSGIQVLVKYFFEGHIMKWIYRLNIDKDNYSEFQLTFKRDL